jgi:hypothetical protein
MITASNGASVAYGFIPCIAGEPAQHVERKTGPLHIGWRLDRLAAVDETIERHGTSPSPASQSEIAFFSRWAPAQRLNLCQLRSRLSAGLSKPSYTSVDSAIYANKLAVVLQLNCSLPLPYKTFASVTCFLVFNQIPLKLERVLRSTALAGSFILRADTFA